MTSPHQATRTRRCRLCISRLPANRPDLDVCHNCRYHQLLAEQNPGPDMTIKRSERGTLAFWAVGLVIAGILLSLIIGLRGGDPCDSTTGESRVACLDDTGRGIAP